MKEFKGYNVLLADDDEITREIVANIVEDLGAICETAQDGVELLRKLNGPNGERFDLVLTDINMPRKGGIAACAEFRASGHPKAKTLPFIGISSDTDRTLFDSAISAGMNSMTLKPITRDVLDAHFLLTLKDNQANTIFCERVQEAIAAAKAKNYFFSTVSHDIRTPLNAIIGFSQLLKMGFKTEEEREQAINAILTSGKTLLQLINDILDLSKLESGMMTIEPAPTSCQKLLKEIADSFRFSNQKSSVEIRCKAEGLPLLMLDPQRLRQIVFNLVGNAYKFTKEGFIEIRAQFDSEKGKRSGTFRLDVEDTGCGISEEDMERIASPYVQVGSSKSRNGGTGLGLAICRQLVDVMGGELELASEQGVGTVFSMIIPNVPVCATVDPARLSATQRIAVSLPPLPPKDKKLRILIADDSKMNLAVLRAMLTRLGIADIVPVADGEEALAILRDSNSPPFDIVLTDMWMPKVDGEALVRAIRADPKLAHLLVYVITADVEIQNSYKAMGFTGILLKPITINSLRLIVHG